MLDQCITTEAMTVLWACTALQQAGVPRAYPSDAVKSAVTQANLRARCDFHITWLTDIVAACAPNTNAHIIKEIEKIKFGEGATGGITGRFYQEEDVTRYMGKLLQLQRERGDPMRTGLTNKVKLDVVKRALPTVGLESWTRRRQGRTRRTRWRTRFINLISSGCSASRLLPGKTFQ